VILLAACGGQGTVQDSGMHVCVATNAEGLVPHTFNRLAVDGAKHAGAAVQVVASTATSYYVASLGHCAAARPAVVVAVSSDMATAVWRAARQYPSQRFALIDATPIDESGQPTDLDNVASVLFNEQEPGYLVGALAGYLEKNKVGSASHNILGILGTNHGPNVDPYIAGYIAGARSIDPGVQVKVTYSDSLDTAFCKQLGITQISGGADILFEVTSRCASGYIDAAYDAGAYAIGSDNDMAFASPAVITSALKRVDKAIEILIHQLQNGQFKSGKNMLSIQDDATGFSTPSSVVPQEIINQVLDIRAQIRSGAITPPSTIPPGI
jgi:basic membrane protein A